MSKVKDTPAEDCMDADCINSDCINSDCINSDCINSDCMDARGKLGDLLHCGNERVELSAAKEILAMEEREKEEVGDKDIRLEVVIKIV